MINLEKCQAIYVGNIDNVVHSAQMLNGYHVNLGSLATGFKEVYDVAVPATATLGSAELLLIFNDETMYDSSKTIADFTIEAGTKARAYHLTVGDVVRFKETLLTGTPVVGKFLIPANGSMLLAVADDLTGATRLAYEIIEETTIGADNASAWRARVIKA